MKKASISYLKKVSAFMYVHRWYLLIAVLTVLFVARPLWPSDRMFMFHDRTQFARVIEFAHAIARGEIPPVYASQFNFGIGYPVFLFYAPLAYWVTATLYLTGIGVVTALKSSMLCATIIGAWGSFTWVSRRFSPSAGFIAAIAFVTSPWVASEIFVRGNIATLWFLALAPWSLWSLGVFEKRKLVASLLISATLLAHNALSLLWLPILVAYSIVAFHKNRIQRLRFVVLTGLMAGAFWIPALFQLPQMHATEVARLTDIHDHFLCVEQIWTTASWGFGGSTRGCVEDGMSFMLGKLHIILALMGIAGTLALMRKHRKTVVDGLFFIWALFLTLYDAAPIWDLVRPLHVIQFPWRLLSIALVFAIGLSGAGAFVLFHLAKTVASRYQPHVVARFAPLLKKLKAKLPKHKLIRSAIKWAELRPYDLLRWSMVGLIVVALLWSAQKFFWAPSVSVQEIETQLASPEYISTAAAYDIPEYVPKTVDYTTWQSYRASLPNSQELAQLQKDFNAFQPNVIYQIVGLVVALTSFVIILWFL